MPRLPTEEQLGARPVANIAGGVSHLNLTMPTGNFDTGPNASIMTLPGRALSELGGSVAGVAATFFELQQKQQHAVDVARIDEAHTKYNAALNDLEMGSERGFMNTRGADVVTRDLFKEYGEQRAAEISKIEETLSNPVQKSEFRKRVELENRSFDNRLYRHVASQTEAYRSEVFKSGVEDVTQQASRGPDQFRNLDINKARLDNLIRTEADRLGIKEGTAEFNSLKSQTTSVFYSAIVDTMIAQGNDDGAKNVFYFADKSDQLTPQARVNLGNKLKIASVNTTARSAATEAWVTYAPASPDAPVRIYDMEESIYKKNLPPEVEHQAIQQLRSRMSGYQAQKKEVEASNISGVLDKFRKGVPSEDLLRSPEFMALDGETRDKVQSHIFNTINTQRGQAEAELNRADRAKARAGFSKYWQLMSDPQALAKMSNNEVLATELELGQDLTNNLMQKWTALRSHPTDIAEATIDQDTFNYYAEESGIKVYGTGADKSTLGKLKHGVELAIDRAQQIKGGKLTRDEKEKLMKSEIERTVIRDKGWFNADKKLPAAAITPSEIKSVRVPYKEIPATQVEQAVNYMRSAGIIPMDMPTEKVIRLHRERIEKAVGRRRAGGSNADIESALRGE